MERRVIYAKFNQHGALNKLANFMVSLCALYGLSSCMPLNIYKLPQIDEIVSLSIEGYEPDELQDKINYKKLQQELNVLNATRWHSRFGGKEGSCALLFRVQTKDHRHIGYGIYASYIFIQDSNYRQLNATGFGKGIDINKYTQLAKIWQSYYPSSC